MQLKIKYQLLGLVLLLGSFALAGETDGQENSLKVITWKDLQVHIQYNNPFKKYSIQQKIDLYEVQKLWNAMADGKEPTEALVNSANEANKRLKEQGIDPVALLELNEKLKKDAQHERRKKLDALFASGKTQIRGYMLPLDGGGQTITEFLLVPWVGACIHTAPPSPSQIIHVVAEEPYKCKELFELVTITGPAKVKSSIQNLYFVDGSDDIHTGFSMRATEIEKD